MIDTDAPDMEFAQLVEIGEFKQLAEAKMPDAVRANVQCEGGGSALRANEAAWQRWALRQRVLVDVSTIETSTTVLGQRVELPVLIAPFALQDLCDADAEIATAKASARGGTIMVLSMSTTRPPEEVGSAASAFWMHLAWHRDRGLMREVVQRATAAGAAAICLTVDLPVMPLWPAAMRHSMAQLAPSRSMSFVFRSPDQAGSDSFGLDASATWADLEWVRSLSSLPLVVKGLMTGQDAVLACEHGADAVVVSNHGGHALDESLATADVLPEIVEAVGGRAEVLVDGGIRSGADVLRALALGACAVMIGRPALWGLVIGGADGAARVLAVLREELEVLMALTGVRCIADIDATTIVLRA